MRRPRAWILAAAFVSAAAAAPAGVARADVDVAASFGHGGVCVQDAATPLDLELRNSSDRPVTVTILVEASSGVGDDAFRYERTVVLGASATRREGFLLAGPAAWMPSGRIDVATEPRTTVRSRRTGPAGPLTADRGSLSIPFADITAQNAAYAGGDQRSTVGILGDARGTVAAALDVVAQEASSGTSQRTVTTPRAFAVDPESLRLAPLSLDGLESLVVCDPDASFCADPAILDGVLDWVALGGHLVVSLGEHAAGFASSPLAEWLPVRWTGTDRADYASVLRALRDDLDLPEGFRLEGPRARVTAPTDPRTRTRVPGLWYERAFGSGTVSVAAFDLRLAAQASGAAPDAILAVEPVLVRDGLPEGWVGKRPWEVSTFDVAGRIGRALQEDAFRPPPVALVVLGLVLYVLVVGPLDWFVLRRMRRERLTTFTFAGAVAAFTLLAYGVSILLFSSDAVVNRVTFVHASDGGRAGREVVRVHDLAGFYAPTGGTRQLSWSMPAAVLGGNLPGLHSSGGVGASLPVVVRGPDPLRSAAEVEVAFRSQRVVHAVAAGTTGRALSLERDPATGAPTVTNGLPVDLDDCWLVLGGRDAHHVGPLARGESRTLDGPPRHAVAVGLGEQLDATEFGGWGGAAAAGDRESFRRFLATVVAAPAVSPERPPAGWEALRRAGIVRDAPRAGRALLVAVASESPVPLPEGDARGTKTVVLTREVDLP